MERLQITEVDRVRVQKIWWKPLLRTEHRGGVACQRFVYQERRIQRQLIFAAISLKQRVINSIPATDHCVFLWGVGKADPRTEVFPIYLNQGSVLQGSRFCEDERA